MAVSLIVGDYGMGFALYQSVQLGFGNGSQRSKLNCDSYSVQWLWEGKIHFELNFLENFSEAVRRF